MSNIIQDETQVWFDKIVLTNNRFDAQPIGEWIEGVVVGHHPPEGTHIHACCPTWSQPRYIWRKFMSREKP